MPGLDPFIVAYTSSRVTRNEVYLTNAHMKHEKLGIHIRDYEYVDAETHPDFILEQSNTLHEYMVDEDGEIAVTGYFERHLLEKTT